MGARHILIFFSGCVTLLAAVEILFRLAVFPDWRIVSRAPFLNHPIYGTFQKPNLEIRRYNPPNYDVLNRTNDDGFRDHQVGFEEDLNSMWIAGLSNSYGGFVEDSETYAQILQDSYGYKNALLASEGHLLMNQVKVMRHLHQKGYRPSMVVLEITLNNNFRPYEQGLDELSRPFFAPEVSDQSQTSEGAAEGLLRRGRGMFWGLVELDFVDVKGRLINNSAIYAWIKVGINSIPFLRSWTLKLGLRSDPATFDNVPLEMLRVGRATPHDHLINDLVTYTSAIEGWVRTELNAEFAVIILPSKHHTNPDWFQRYLKIQGSDGTGLDPARPHDLFVAALEKKGIPVLSLAKPMLGAGQFLNYPDDGHFNARGHAIIARELAEWLKERFRRVPDLVP